jgi:hypothetical protein
MPAEPTTVTLEAVASPADVALPEPTPAAAARGRCRQAASAQSCEEWFCLGPSLTCKEQPINVCKKYVETNDTNLTYKQDPSMAGSEHEKDYNI